MESNMFLKDSKGEKSGTYTFAWISFFYGLFLITVSLFESVQIGEHNLKIRQIDSSVLLFLWGPSFSLYGFKKYLNRKFGPEKTEKSKSVEKEPETQNIPDKE